MPDVAVVKLWYKRREAAQVLSISPSMLDRLAKMGLITPVYVGHHPRYHVDELSRYASSAAVRHPQDVPMPSKKKAS